MIEITDSNCYIFFEIHACINNSEYRMPSGTAMTKHFIYNKINNGNYTESEFINAFINTMNNSKKFNSSGVEVTTFDNVVFEMTEEPNYYTLK